MFFPKYWKTSEIKKMNSQNVGKNGNRDIGFKKLKKIECIFGKKLKILKKPYL